VPTSAAPTSTAPAGQTDFNIADEFGTAKRNLPPARIVLIGVAIVLVIAGIASMVQRPKPQGAGQIDSITDAEVPNQNMVLVAMNVTFRNTGSKSLYVHTVKGVLKTDSEEVSDDPVSQVDYDRYFQAFPALKTGAGSALLPETKVSPGVELHGTVIVAFDKDKYDKKKSLSVVIQPYDQPVPIVLTK
jgi:hypothetical protein